MCSFILAMMLKEMKPAKMPLGWVCSACGGATRFSHERCFMCGSYRDALFLLSQQNINPDEIYNILTGQKDFHGITMHIARMVIEVFRTSHNEPH